MLDTARGREGHLAVNVTVTGSVIPVVLARSDLYVMGFQCAGNWFRFDDAGWPFSETVTKLGYDGQYGSLGGLAGNLTAGAIDGIARLGNIANRPQWKEALRTLLVVVSECARLIPVRMQITGLLNGFLSTVPLASLARYIQNWDIASKGTDMSREEAPNLRVGFRDPTIIKR
jgi:Ribosome inactivating protein